MDICSKCGDVAPLTLFSGFTFCHPPPEKVRWCRGCIDRVTKPRMFAAMKQSPDSGMLHLKNTLKGRDPIAPEEASKLWGVPDLVLRPPADIPNAQRKYNGIALVYWVFFTDQAPGGCIVCGFYKHGCVVNPHKQMGWSYIAKYMRGGQVVSIGLKIESAGYPGTLITTSGTHLYRPLIFNTGRHPEWCPSKKTLIKLHPSSNGMKVIRKNLKKVPEHAGCYALILGKDVLYVGQSINLRKRVARFGDMGLLEGNEEVRLHLWFDRDPVGLEGLLIKFLRPKRNIHGKSEKFPKLCGWSVNGAFREYI